MTIPGLKGETPRHAGAGWGTHRLFSVHWCLGRCVLWWDLVGSFGAAFLEAFVEGLSALEAGFYGVPVVDFCFA